MTCRSITLAVALTIETLVGWSSQGVAQSMPAGHSMPGMSMPGMEMPGAPTQPSSGVQVNLGPLTSTTPPSAAFMDHHEALYGAVLFDQLEYRGAGNRTNIGAWEGQAYYGGDYNKFWVNTLVMAYTADDVIFADYPMFRVAGFFGRGIMAIADGMEIVIPAPGGARDKRFIENYWKFVEKFRITTRENRAPNETKLLI